MTNLHQFHRIVENIRFITEDLEAPIDRRETTRSRSIQKASRHQDSQSFIAKKKRKPQSTQAHEFCLYESLRGFSNRILGLEKGKKTSRFLKNKTNGKQAA